MEISSYLESEGNGGNRAISPLSIQLACESYMQGKTSGLVRNRFPRKCRVKTPSIAMTHEYSSLYLFRYEKNFLSQPII